MFLSVFSFSAGYTDNVLTISLYYIAKKEATQVLAFVLKERQGRSRIIFLSIE